MRFLTKDWYLKYIQVEWIKTLILNDNGFEEFTLAETLFECERIYWVEK